MMHLGKALLTAFFLEHNCTDAHNTGYVFRFQRTADLVSCQEALRTAMPHLFAFSPSTTALLHLAEPTRVGELWVVYKVGKNETSCVLYREFFWK